LYGALPQIGVLLPIGWRKLFAVRPVGSAHAAAHSTGEDRMDTLVIIAVFLVAVAQVLTILLTFRRERDIKELRQLVDEQRLHIVELRAWLAGRNAAQPRRAKSEHEPISEPTASNMKASEPAITPKDLPVTIQPRTPEDEAAQAMKVLNWQREIVAGLQAGLKGGAPPEPAITPKATDTVRPGTTEDAFKWFKEDADEPHGIVEAREIVAGLKGAPGPGMTGIAEPAIARKDSPDIVRPSTTTDELKRTYKAINWLKEDADKARVSVAGLPGTPLEKKIG
jgi:hypothetical protein